MEEVIKGLKEANAELLKRVETAETKQVDLEKKQAEQIESLKHLRVGPSSDSSEQKAIRFFGCSDARQLLHVNTEATEFKGVPEDAKQIVRELKKSVDVSRWIGQIFFGEGRDNFGVKDGHDNLAQVKSILSHPYGRDVLAARIKAFGTGVVGGGAEWVPTAISTQYIAEYELEKRVATLFTEVNMPTNPYKLPKRTSHTKARIIGQGSTMTGTNFNTSDITFDATKLGEYYELPEELNEDSAPDILAVGRMEVMEAQIRAIEAGIISGDDDGTHIDSDIQAGAADLAEKAWKGLRRQALANSANGVIVDFGNAVIGDTKLTEMLSAGGKFVISPRDCAWIVSPKAYVQLCRTTNVVTVDKFGAMATILNGYLAAYAGIGIVISEYVREDLNATGVYDGTTTDRGSILLVNKARWMLGRRRGIMVKVTQDPNIANDRWLLASYSRHDFQGHAQSANETSVVYGMNIKL